MNSEDTVDNKYINKVTNVIYPITIVLIIVSGILNNSSVENIIKISVFSIVFIIITFLYIKLNQQSIFDDKKERTVFFVGYIVSLVMLLISIRVQVYNLWMFGPVLIAMFVDLSQGLIFNFMFAFLMSILANSKVEWLAFSFVLGTIACLLSKYLKKIKLTVYTAAILITSNITLLFLMNNFISKEEQNLNMIYSVCSMVILILLLFLANIVVNKIFDKEIKETYLSMEKLLSYDFELLMRLKEYSDYVYTHSVDVAEVSYQAAISINANENIAKAGGLYHDIGKMQGKDYIKEGISIAREYHFPKEVIDVIEQHNSKGNNPKSIEAAIVMLSDSIISTMNYLEKQPKEKQLPSNKIIEEIFKRRLANGNLDESGLSIQKLKKLKEFFINNYFCL